MELILHNHRRSIFSEKVRRILAYKGLAWSDVEVPSIPPKTNFVPLTGGYRRIPVLQIGADVYCDSSLIARKLEEIAPNPSVFPEDAAGIAEMIADWADHRVAMWSIISVFPEILPHASPEFIKDRAELVADFAPDRIEHLAPHTFEQFKQSVALVDSALSRHAFVACDAFSVADAACYHLLSFAKSSSRVFAPVDSRPRIVDWMERIANFPAPNIETKSDLYPLEVAKAASPKDIGDFTGGGEAFRIGETVRVAADDYATNEIVGEVVKISPNEIAVRQVSDALGEIAIHFPRLGFSIRPAHGAGAG